MRDRTQRAARRALVMILVVPILGVAMQPARGADYLIEIDGPLGHFSYACSDPCEFDETRDVGNAGGGIAVAQAGKKSRTGSLTRSGADRSYAEDNITCIGDCIQQGPTNTIVIGAVRALTEGVEVRVREGRARFIFHTVVEQEAGPVTRRQVSEFEIDRPFIELELSEHAVIVQETASDQDASPPDP